MCSTCQFSQLYYACLGLVLACLSAGAVGIYSDPLFPAEQDFELSAEQVSLYQIPPRINELKLQIEEERVALEQLAPLRAAKQFDAFGYHSDYIPVVAEIPDQPLWTLDFDVGINNRSVSGLVFVPTIDESFD